MAVAAIVTVTAIVTARAVDATLPGLRVFALTFVLLLGVLTAVAVARSRRLRWPRLGLGIAGLVAVAAAIAVTVLNLRAAAVLDTGSAVTLGVILAAFLWLTITPARAPAGRRIGAGIAVGTALLLGGGLLLAARTGDGVLFYLMLAPVPAIFLGSLVVALAARSFGAGLRAGVSSIVLTGLVAFVVLGAYALRIGQPSILDGDAGGPGVNDGTVWALLNLPLWTLPFGIIGAGIGAVAGASRDPDTVRPA